MTVENGLLETVRARLIADATLIGLIGERVYVFQASETAAFPCVTVSTPMAAMPDDAYHATRDTLLDVMVIGRAWSSINDVADRVKVLLDLQPLTVTGATVFDTRLDSSAFYHERVGRDTFFYGVSRFIVRYTQ